MLPLSRDLVENISLPAGWLGLCRPDVGAFEGVAFACPAGGRVAKAAVAPLRLAGREAAEGSVLVALSGSSTDWAAMVARGPAGLDGGPKDLL